VEQILNIHIYQMFGCIILAMEYGRRLNLILRYLNKLVLIVVWLIIGNWWKGRKKILRTCPTNKAKPNNFQTNKATPNTRKPAVTHVVRYRNKNNYKNRNKSKNKYKNKNNVKVIINIQDHYN
jgi:hypothetical protein